MIIGWLTGIFFIHRHLPVFGDELHFVETIRNLGANFDLNTMVDYKEVTGPLVFVIYALWGKVVGFEADDLRLLSLIFSTATVWMIYRWYRRLLKGKYAAVGAVLLFLLNPYVWGISFLVYTDIVTLFFIALLAGAVYRERPVLIFLASAAALLCRQYSVFVVIAAGWYIVFAVWRRRLTVQFRSLIALVLGGLPLAILMIYWRGFAPAAGRELWIIPDSRFYHCDYITTYVAFTTVYLLPIILLMYKQLFHGKIILLCLILTGWYLIFPVEPSHVTLAQSQYDTVGIMHRMIVKLTGGSTGETIMLAGFFWCGLVMLTYMIIYDYKRFRSGEWDYGHFLTLTVLSFMLIMPLSYQVWEKYLVMVLPFMIARLVMIGQTYSMNGEDG